MALQNKIDVTQAKLNLESWFRARWPERGMMEVRDVVVPKESGISAETLMFTLILPLSWGRSSAKTRLELVARVQPRTGGIWQYSDLQPEFDVLLALGKCPGIPVPQVFELVRDESVLGAPFLLMEKISGRVPRDDPPFTASGWVLDLTAEKQSLLHDNGLKALADLHAVDYKAAGLDSLRENGIGGGTLAGAIAHWKRFYEFAAEGRPNRTLDAAFSWLERNQPSEAEPIALSWGDARLGNMIFNDDLSVAAIIDWELAGLASPEADLGWWIFIMKHHTEGIGLPMPPGFPGPEQTIARYEALSGHTVRHFDFYYVYAALRISLAFFRAGHLMISSGMLPPDSPMPNSNPASQLLAKALDLPPPGISTQTYIGNR